MAKWLLSTIFMVQLSFGQSIHVHILDKKFDSSIVSKSHVSHARDGRDLMTREKEFQQKVIKQAGVEFKFKHADYWELEELLDLLEKKSLTDVQKRFTQLTSEEARRLLNAYHE